MPLTHYALPRFYDGLERLHGFASTVPVGGSVKGSASSARAQHAGAAENSVHVVGEHEGRARDEGSSECRRSELEPVEGDDGGFMPGGLAYAGTPIGGTPIIMPILNGALPGVNI